KVRKSSNASEPRTRTSQRSEGFNPQRSTTGYSGPKPVGRSQTQMLSNRSTRRCHLKPSLATSASPCPVRWATFELPPAVSVQVMVAARAEASVSTSAPNANRRQRMEQTQTGRILNFEGSIALSIFAVRKLLFDAARHQKRERA